MRRVSVVEEVAPRKKETAPETSYQPPARPSTLEVVIAAFAGLGYAISARALLLLSLIFVFTLAVMAMMIQTIMALYILIAGGVLTVLPSAVLEIKRRAP